MLRSLRDEFKCYEGAFELVGHVFSITIGTKRYEFWRTLVLDGLHLSTSMGLGMFVEHVEVMKSLRL